MVATTLEGLGSRRAREYITRLRQNDEHLIESLQCRGIGGFVKTFLDLENPGDNSRVVSGLSVAWNELQWFAEKIGISEEALLDSSVHQWDRGPALSI